MARPPRCPIGFFDSTTYLSLLFSCSMSASIIVPRSPISHLASSSETADVFLRNAWSTARKGTVLEKIDGVIPAEMYSVCTSAREIAPSQPIRFQDSV